MELAINDYGMIRPGDRILVGISGGQDSFALLRLLSLKKIFVPNDITLIPVHIDLGFDVNNYLQLEQLRLYFEKQYDEYLIEKSDIGPLAHSELNRLNPCFTCSRLRRKRLLKIAEMKGCTSIAFGHHKDDIIETLLINIFFGREISTMKARQTLFNGKFHIIRPLAYIWEEKIKAYSFQQGFPIIENKCPSSETSKRKFIKDLLNELASEHGQIKENIFKSLKHVKPDYLL